MKIKKNTIQSFFQIGDAVKVKAGVMDPDNPNLSIEGWQGRVLEIIEALTGDELIIEVEWDSITLKSMPENSLLMAIDAELEYKSMNLAEANLEPAEGRDEIEDVKESHHIIDQRFLSEKLHEEKSIVLYLNSYAITDEPLDLDYQSAPDFDKHHTRLYFLLQDNPKKAVAKLEHLKKKYPDNPILLNFLYTAYNQIGDNDQTEKLALENYQKNPDYLFAKVNYAQFCLEKNDLAQIPIIFDNKFDLQELYPDRDVFHTTEAINFFAILGFYFIEVGARKQAKLCCKVLKKLAPDLKTTIFLKWRIRLSFVFRLKKTVKSKKQMNRGN